MVRAFAIKNLMAIRAALDRHNAECPLPAREILLNPIDHDLLGWQALWGVPVRPDERVGVKRIRIDCEGSAWEAERQLLPPDES